MSKKGYATPPAPQNSMRRMRFFVEHQDDPRFPEARDEAIKISADRAAKMHRKKAKMERPVEQPIKSEVDSFQKSSILDKIKSKFNK